MSIVDHFISHEGLVSHLYLDTATPAVVTVGVGHALFTLDECLALPWDQPREQVRLDWEAVRKQKPGMLASYYARFTKSRLSESFCRELCTRDIVKFEASLIEHLPSFPQYPESARTALLDMAYNLGVNGLVTKFPKLMAAVREQDWMTAAGQCRRKGIADSRNQATTDRFKNAVRLMPTAV